MKFEKCTLSEAMRAYADLHGIIPDCAMIRGILAKLIPPSRSTPGSVGYDFRSPFEFKLRPGETISIPLFFKALEMPKDIALFIYNRSGLSLVKGLRLDNSVGVIDSDYCKCIIFQATATRYIEVKFNDKICQGIFQKVYYVDDDELVSKKKRKGGLGSTDE